MYTRSAAGVAVGACIVSEPVTNTLIVVGARVRVEANCRHPRSSGGHGCWHAPPWLLVLTTGAWQWSLVLRVRPRAYKYTAQGVNCR